MSPTTRDVYLVRLICILLMFVYAVTVYTAVIVAFAAMGVIGLDTAPPWWVHLSAFALIGLGIVPVSQWIHHHVEQLVYGWPDDLYETFSQVQAELTTDSSSLAVVPTALAAIRTTLQLPYAAITSFATGETVQSGTALPGTEHVAFPLTYGTTAIGTLNVAARRPARSFSQRELQLLRDLARQVGIALHAALLNEALQASREQLVLAREEERRRIRRDLHDGLGPTLASLRLQLAALRQHVAYNPAAAQLIDELRSDVRAATAEIRRLVYDLRPPMLDEFGLLGALRHLESSSSSLEQVVEAPDALPPLPAAIEVAIYRIAAEALHNIVRHAHATRCVIGIALDQTTLTLTVMDNGCGLPANYLAGVGHHSMYERAAELGGSVTIRPAPTGGTCVTATFLLKGGPDD